MTTPIRIMMAIALLALLACDPASRPPTNILDTTEADDTWLHEHCAYLGSARTSDSKVALRPGEIAALGAATENKEVLYKRFACREKPAQYTEAWSPVKCGAFRGEERAACEAKFRRAPAP